MFKLNFVIFFLMLVKDNQWVLAELSPQTVGDANTLERGPFGVLQLMQPLVPVGLPLFAGVMTFNRPRSQQYQPRYHTAVEEAGNCTKSSGSGLTSLIRQANAILPLKKIQQLIVDSVTNDPQVGSILQLVQADSLLDRLQTIRQTSEYTDLLDYVCQVLHLNPKEMAGFVKNFALVTSEVKPSAGEFKGRPGIRGLLQDIRAVIPQQKLKDLYAGLIESDANLRESVERVNSPEFRQLVRNLRGLEAYQEVREALVKAGVPLREWSEMISDALGWSGLQFVSF